MSARLSVFAVVDRATNNVLGEWLSHEDAERFLVELVARDPSASMRCEIVRGQNEAHNRPAGGGMSDLRQAIEDADDNYAAGQRHGQLAERERILRIIRERWQESERVPVWAVLNLIDLPHAAVVGGQHTTEQQEER